MIMLLNIGEMRRMHYFYRYFEDEPIDDCDKPFSANDKSRVIAQTCNMT